MHHLVYLHGFLSSPQSVKAQSTLTFVTKHYPNIKVYIPQIPGDLAKAVPLVENLIKTLPIDRTGFIGSSMGGFLATYCLEKYAAKASSANSSNHLASTHLPKAVLINPAVTPSALLADYIGQHTNPYTKEVFDVQERHINLLRQLYVETLEFPQRYKVLLQKGDETLDYTLASTKYSASCLHIEEAGNHSFVDYERHLPTIMQFLIAK